MDKINYKSMKGLTQIEKDEYKSKYFTNFSQLEKYAQFATSHNQPFDVSTPKDFIAEAYVNENYIFADDYTDFVLGIEVGGEENE